MHAPRRLSKISKISKILLKKGNSSKKGSFQGFFVERSTTAAMGTWGASPAPGVHLRVGTSADRAPSGVRSIARMINVARERAWRAWGVGCAPSRFRHGRLRWCEWVRCDGREAQTSSVANSRAENERGRTWPAAASTLFACRSRSSAGC